MQFPRQPTDRPAKMALPGPFTMAQQARNEFYRDVEEMAMDFALAVNAEARELQAAGAGVRPPGGPRPRNDPGGPQHSAVPAVNPGLPGPTLPTARHPCFR